MNQLEIEVKFFIEDLPGIRRKILKLGAECQGRFFESNIRFEDDGCTFKQRRSLLRLRQDARTTLTFKSPLPDVDGQFKIQRKLEVVVDDFDGMHAILTALGYHAEQVYEKWRETFILDDAVLCLDTMPYGVFLEIEGRREAIVAVSRSLELVWERRILLNYLTMFHRIRQARDLPFSDLTFENFKTVSGDLSPHILEMEAGVQQRENR